MTFGRGRAHRNNERTASSACANVMFSPGTAIAGILREGLRKTDDCEGARCIQVKSLSRNGNKEKISLQYREYFILCVACPLPPPTLQGFWNPHPAPRPPLRRPHRLQHTEALRGLSAEILDVRTEGVMGVKDDSKPRRLLLELKQISIHRDLRMKLGFVGVRREEGHGGFFGGKGEFVGLSWWSKLFMLLMVSLLTLYIPIFYRILLGISNIKTEYKI